MSYTVELDVYNGPLDLLLYLIKRDEVDIREIEVARVADQYIAYLDLLKDLEIELAGEFLVMASTLLELKSRALLPRAPAIDEGEEEGEGEEDPRETLIRQLLEYRRYKEAAGMLAERGGEMARRYPREVDDRRLRDLVAGEEGGIPAHELLEGVEVWDLFGAFSQVIKTLGYSRPREVVYDETSVEEAAEDLIVRLKAEKSVLFTDLFDREQGLGYAITLFLALLELMRQRRIGVEQEDDFGRMRLYVRDPSSETYTQRKPRGAAASRDGLQRKHPRRPTARQTEQLQEMREDVELEKTEFDEALDAIDVPDVEPFHPIYSDAEILGRDETDIPAPKHIDEDADDEAESTDETAESDAIAEGEDGSRDADEAAPPESRT